MIFRLPLLLACGALLLAGCGPSEFGAGFGDDWDEGGAEVLWETSVGPVGKRQALQLVGDSACVVNLDGEVLLVDLATGDAANPAAFELTAEISGSGGCTPSKAAVIDSGARIHAIDWNAPERGWSKPLEGNLLGAPLQVGNTLLAAMTDGTVIAYTLFTGDELWRLELNESEFRYDGKFKPRLVDDYVVFGTPEGTLYHIDTIDGFISWEGRLFNQRDPDPTANLSLIAGPDVEDETTCGVAYNGVAGCFDEQGRELWQKEISSAGTVRIIDGNLHLVSASGTLLALSAENGRELWRSEGASSHRSPMVAAHGRLIVVENGFIGLSFYAAADGQLAGGLELDGEVLDYIETEDGLLLLTADGYLSRIVFG